MRTGEVIGDVERTERVPDCRTQGEIPVLDELLTANRGGAEGKEREQEPGQLEQGPAGGEDEGQTSPGHGNLLRAKEPRFEPGVQPAPGTPKTPPHVASEAGVRRDVAEDLVNQRHEFVAAETTSGSHPRI